MVTTSGSTGGPIGTTGSMWATGSSFIVPRRTVVARRWPWSVDAPWRNSPAWTGDLQTHPRCTPHVRGTRHEPRQALRTCEAQQEPHDLPGGLPLPPIVVPERGPHRDGVDVMII